MSSAGVGCVMRGTAACGVRHHRQGLERFTDPPSGLVLQKRQRRPLAKGRRMLVALQLVPGRGILRLARTPEPRPEPVLGAHDCSCFSLW